MTRRRPGIGSELLPVILIVLCLAGTLGLVITVHRRAAPRRREPAQTAMLPNQNPLPLGEGGRRPGEGQRATNPQRVQSPAAEAPPPPQPPPQPDATEQALAKLALAQNEQIAETQSADRKAEALESARQAALARLDQSRRRETLIRNQIELLSAQARRLETELDEVAIERDVLARERDAAKAALAKARNRSSYAVLPHKGPNGTWRRPIILECQNGQATLQPGGPSFSLLDLSMILGPRSAPLVAAVAREVVRAQAQESPDGAPVVPYIFFVIRPDGIKPYYSARAQLEPLGIAFGYELVDQNMEIDYPDLDNLEEWDSPVSPRSVPGRPGNPHVAAAPTDRPWPGPAPPARDSGSRGPGDSPDTFVWPSRPELAAAGAGAGNGNRDVGHDRSSRGEGTLDGNSAGGGSANGNGPAGARNGLGRGGSGVDPVPLGTPVLGSENPYDNPGSVSGPSGVASGGGLAPVPGGRRGHAFADGLTDPAQGTGLVPISPQGMPSLEEPRSSGNGNGNGGASSRSPADAGGGGWRAAGRVQGSAPGGNDAPATPPSGPSGGDSNDPAQGAPQSVAGSAGTVPGQGAKPGQPPSGNFNPGLGAPPSLSQLARLAGAVSGADSGSGGQPQSASPFGIPLPLAGAAGAGSSGDDEVYSGQHDSKPGAAAQRPRSRSDLKKPMTIDVPFEVVVACSAEGVVLHPGGYRLSAKALKANDGLLLRDLKSIVETRRQVDPTIHPRPSIRFLIEPGGGETYRDARRQTVLAGIDWPIAIQIADSDILDNLTPQEPF
jgi:hypothetical protein